MKIARKLLLNILRQTEGTPKRFVFPYSFWGKKSLKILVEFKNFFIEVTIYLVESSRKENILIKIENTLFFKN